LVTHTNWRFEINKGSYSCPSASAADGIEDQLHPHTNSESDFTFKLFRLIIMKSRLNNHLFIIAVVQSNKWPTSRLNAPRHLATVCAVYFELDQYHQQTLKRE
jgi:hypothetical protein